MTPVSPGPMANLTRPGASSANELARLASTNGCRVTGLVIAGYSWILVVCAAAHRQDALQACSFLIDWLKTQAPFWKSESTAAGEQWVKAKESDDALAARWQKT